MVEENKDVSAEAQAQVVEEQKETGEMAQDAAEKPSPVEINWQRANETMKAQSHELRALRAELDQYKQTTMQKQPLINDKSDDDIYTAGEIKKVLAERDKAYQAHIQELSIKSKYSDYDGVIEKYGKQLPESVKQAILSSNNPHLAAYEACKSSEAYYKDSLTSTQHADAKKVTANLSKPGSASSVGNAGALGKASYYEGLSEGEILDLSNRYLRG